MSGLVRAKNDSFRRRCTSTYTLIRFSSCRSVVLETFCFWRRWWPVLSIFGAPTYPYWLCLIHVSPSGKKVLTNICIQFMDESFDISYRLAFRRWACTVKINLSIVDRVLWNGWRKVHLRSLHSCQCFQEGKLFRAQCGIQRRERMLL